MHRLVEIRETSRLMSKRYGAYSYAHHLVKVAALCVAPGAIRKRRGVLLRASMRGLINVDASGNRLFDLDTLELTEFNATNAWKQNFSNGNQNNNNKNNTNYVRAVRK